MSKKPKILVVDSNLHTLSRIYLSLVHKDYKVEATDDAQEILARTERFKPRLIILNADSKNLTQEIFIDMSQKKLDVILIANEEQNIPVQIKKMQVVKMPSDVSFFDEKIKEILNITE